MHKSRLIPKMCIDTKSSISAFQYHRELLFFNRIKKSGLVSFPDRNDGVFNMN